MTKTAMDAARSVYQWTKERSADPKEVWGIPWGFPGLDFLTGGIQKEELTVLGADSGVGKSALSGQITLNVARWLKENRPGEVVRVIQTEMTAEAFFKRLACHLAQVKGRKLAAGKATDEELARVKAALTDVAGLPIEVLDEPKSLEDTASFIRGRSKDDLPCAWWLIDYLQDHPARENSRATETHQVVTEAMPVYRNLAKMVAPGLLTSQFTKGIAERSEGDHPHRPEAGDLYGGRSILATANVILLLYRPDHYKQLEPGDRGKTQYAELIVAKNRDGEQGTVKLWFHPSFAEYLDASSFLEED